MKMNKIELDGTWPKNISRSFTWPESRKLSLIIEKLINPKVNKQIPVHGMIVIL